MTSLSARHGQTFSLFSKSLNCYALVWHYRKFPHTRCVVIFQDQYIFVYDAVLEAWKSGDTAIPTTKFKEAYEELLEEDPETNKTKLAKQFEVS